MASTLEDKELNEALRISVQPNSDEEDDDLRRAIQLSLQETKQPHPEPESSSNLAKEQPPGQSSFLSERAKMEQERIARLKRLRPDSEQEEAPSSKRRSPSASSSGSTGTKAVNTLPPSRPQDGLFWEGEIRQTAVRPADPRKDGQPTFRLSVALGNKSEIAFAVLSTYSMMLSWVYSLFDPSVPVLLIAPPNQDGAACMHYVLPNWMRTSPPLRGGRGAMHVKLMLIFYKTGRLRVVIPTANLVDFDYRDIENTMWLQDIPLASKPFQSLGETKGKKKSPLEEDFATSLERTLKSLHVPPALELMLKDHPDLPLKSVEDLSRKWDWSKVKALLVPAMSGKHEGWEKVVKQGHPRLMAVIRALGLELNKQKGKSKQKELQLECQGSSIGQYSTQWVNEFYHSASGKSAEDWLDEPKSRRTKLPYPPIKIVYPSLETVKQSVLGERGGGTMFCRRQQWSAKNFPRTLFCDSKSKAGGVLMHSKMIIATITNSSQTTIDLTRSDDESKEEDDFVGWAYIGSANFTPSAWGTISGSAFNPSLNIVNYELGVVLPLTSKQQADRIACYQRPPPKYAAGKDIPWFQDESATLNAQQS